MTVTISFLLLQLSWLGSGPVSALYLPESHAVESYVEPLDLCEDPAVEFRGWKEEDRPRIKRTVYSRSLAGHHVSRLHARQLVGFCTSVTHSYSQKRQLLSALAVPARLLTFLKT